MTPIPWCCVAAGCDLAGPAVRTARLLLGSEVKASARICASPVCEVWARAALHAQIRPAWMLSARVEIQAGTGS